MNDTTLMKIGRRGLYPCLALTLVAAAPGSLRGQQDSIPGDTAVFRIQGISVQARRPATTVGGASAVEVRLDSLELPAVPTVEEVLREIPSVHVRTNSRGQAEVSVRGSESRQVAVLLDGVPLTLGWDARTDVSVLPATAVHDVSFIRGLSTVLHGPNVLGGVVEMSLARVDDLPTEGAASAGLGVDHLGGYGVTATLTRPFEAGGGAALIRAGVGWRDSPGVPLADGITEPVPGERDRRLNTDVENVDGFLAFRYNAESGAWASLSAVGHRAERGIAAELGAREPRFWRYPNVSRGILAVSGGTGQRDTPWGSGDLEASVGLDFGRTDIRSYASRAYERIVGSEDGDDRTVTLRLLGDHTLGSRGDLRFAGTFADIHHDEVVDGVARSFQQRLSSLGVETIWRVLERRGAGIERLRLSLGGAYDRGSTPETGGLEPLGAIHDWGARVGLSAVTRGGSTILHAGLSRRGRFPSLREAFSEALNRFVPNPDLSPEHLVAVEAGVTTRMGEGEVQVVGFHHRLTDAIRRITFPDRRRKRVNSDELTSTGVELLVSQTLGSVDVGADLTLQAVELTDPDAVSSEPENLPEQAGRGYARIRFGSGAALTAEAEYTGSQFCQDPDTGEDVELDDGVRLGAGLSKAWSLGRGGQRVEVRVAGDNLTDTALFDQCGLPRPGRLIRFQLRVF